jgi:hypothetical protein
MRQQLGAAENERREITASAQLRLEFIEYVKDLATGASGFEEIERLINLRQAIDAMTTQSKTVGIVSRRRSHRAVHGWKRTRTWLPGDERG